MSDNQRVIEIEVLRYNPEKDTEPFKQVFDVPFTDDMSVLPVSYTHLTLPTSDLV